MMFGEGIGGELMGRVEVLSFILGSDKGREPYKTDDELLHAVRLRVSEIRDLVHVAFPVNSQALRDHTQILKGR
jgi:hypothetical protein